MFHSVMMMFSAIIVFFICILTVFIDNVESVVSHSFENDLLKSSRVVPDLPIISNSSGCTYEHIECKNGGVFNAPCVYSYYPCDDMRHSAYVCECPPGWHGVDCSIPDATTCNATKGANGTHYIFDGSPLNPDMTRSYECYLNPTDGKTFSVCDHHVDMVVAFPKLNFTVMSRVKNTTGVKYHWIPVIKYLDCHMDQCTYEYLPHDPNNQIYIKCGQVNCTACTIKDLCSPYVAIASKLVHPPLTLQMRDVHTLSNDDLLHNPPKPAHYADYNGTGTWTMDFLTDAMNMMDIVCYSGSCVTEIPHVPSVKYNSFLWVTLGALSIGFLGCIALTYAAYRNVQAASSLPDHVKYYSVKEEETHESSVLTNKSSVLPVDDSEEQTQRLLSPLHTSTGTSLVSPLVGSPDSDIIGFQLRQTRHVELQFDGIEYGVPTQQPACASSPSHHTTYKEVLRNVSGYVGPGQLVGILGVSGAGKTTLLDILAGRQKVGHLKGRLCVRADGETVAFRRNGVVYSPHSADQDLSGDDISIDTPSGNDIVDALSDATFTSYVPAEDCLLETQTVFETLVFNARLGLPESVNLVTIQLLVMQLIWGLGLQEVAHSVVGDKSVYGDADSHKGLSTGERKRLSLGKALITQPHLLLLDEPTSGLDSHNAGVLVKMLYEACHGTLGHRHEAKHAVSQSDKGSLLTILSIHQPPPHVYRLLDSVILLTPRGRIAYCGPAATVKKFLDEIHLTAPQLLNQYQTRKMNPADVLLMASSRHPDELNEQFVNGSFGHVAAADIREFWERTVDSHRLEDIKNAQADGEATGYVTQIVYLTSRMFIHVSRKPSLLLLLMLIALISALILGGFFYQLNDQIGGSQDRAGFLFFVIFFFSLTSLSSLAQFSAERRMYTRETQNGLYSAFPYLVSKIVSDFFPLRIVPPLLFGCITYWMIGFQDDPFRFVNYLMIIVLVNVVATSACFAAASWTADAAKANLCVVVFFVFSMLFGGFFLNQASGSATTWFFAYCRYASFFHYAYSALMINEFSDLSLVFNPVGFPSVVINGNQYLAEFAITVTEYSFDILMLGVICIAFFSIGFLNLKFNSASKR